MFILLDSNNMKNINNIKDRREIFKKTANKAPFLAIMVVFLSVVLSSCAIPDVFSIGDIRYLDLWCIEELSDNAVLAVYAEEDNYNTVKIIKCGERYNEWQRIQDIFTCVDYWTYETVQGEIRTIPVVVKTSKYDNFKKQRGY